MAAKPLPCDSAAGPSGPKEQPSRPDRLSEVNRGLYVQIKQSTRRRGGFVAKDLRLRIRSLSLRKRGETHARMPTAALASIPRTSTVNLRLDAQPLRPN